MSSVRDNRQRAAARARLEREMAARQEAARRQRRRQAYIGGTVAVLLVAGVITWIVVATTGNKPTSTTAAASCYWQDTYPNEDPASLPSGIANVGTPPTDPQKTGFQTLTFETNLGEVQVEMDLSKTPCTAASLSYLSTVGYYDNVSCHRLVPSIFALQCGDPTGTSQGGITYQFADENLPAASADGSAVYHLGDVAMANTGSAGSNGAQFFFVYGDSPLPNSYSLFGKVIKGLDIIQQVGNAGFQGDQSTGEGAPNQAFTFTSVTASDPYPVSATTATDTASDTAAASPAAS